MVGAFKSGVIKSWVNNKSEKGCRMNGYNIVENNIRIVSQIFKFINQKK